MNKNIQSEKYSILSLKQENISYDSEHIVMQSDTDMANRYVALIESTRSTITPKAGDVLMYTNQQGDYYAEAHIDYNRDGVCNICEHPYVPFIGSDGSNGIWCSSSGGAWHNLKSSDLRYVGKRLKVFKDWGHRGARANGAVLFSAEVSVWEYIHPEPHYENCSTHKWTKMYVTAIEEENRKDYGGNCYMTQTALSCGATSGAFRTESEFQQFVMDYKAKIFPGNWANQLVVFCYRRQDVFITQEQFDVLDLPVISISICCSKPCSAKVQYDDENKIMYTHLIK